MTVHQPLPTMADIIPSTAPFSNEQRQWLNGFFAGLLSIDRAGVTALSPEENAQVLEPAEAAALCSYGTAELRPMRLSL
jgi:sulfite reductase (NADPH) flavoprotein alpha-component